MNKYPNENEFLIFYLIQISCKQNLFKQNLAFEQINNIIVNYSFCYELYIINKQLLPPKKCVIDYI